MVGLSGLRPGPCCSSGKIWGHLLGCGEGRGLCWGGELGLQVKVCCCSRVLGRGGMQVPRARSARSEAAPYLPEEVKSPLFSIQREGIEEDGILYRINRYQHQTPAWHPERLCLSTPGPLDVGGGVQHWGSCTYNRAGSATFLQGRGGSPNRQLWGLCCNVSRAIGLGHDSPRCWGHVALPRCGFLPLAVPSIPGPSCPSPHCLHSSVLNACLGVFPSQQHGGLPSHVPCPPPWLPFSLPPLQV